LDSKELKRNSVNPESAGKVSEKTTNAPETIAYTSKKPGNEFLLQMVAALQPECMVTNLQGRILFITPSFHARLGNIDLSRGSLLEFIPLQKQKDIHFVFKTVAETQQSKKTTLHLQSEQDQVLSINILVKCFLDEKNKPLLLISPDLTRGTRSETDNSLHGLQSIIEQSPLSFTITDLEGTIQYVNAQFERITGYSRDEVIGKNPRILKSGNTGKEVYHNLWMTITSGRTWKGEFRNRRKNGEEYWEIASVSPVMDSSGQMTHFIAIKEDITVRKAIIEKFAEGEERLRIIVEATGDILYKFSYVDDRYEYMNPAIVKLTGYTVDELNSIKLSSIVQELSLISKEAEQKAADAAESIYGERGDYRAEYLIRTKQGDLKWIEDHSYPWYDADHLLIGSVGILSDISGRKKTELELKRAKEDAESMNRLKDVFLSNMSHELRTPMISILGYSEILNDITDDGETKEISSIIHQSAIRLTDTINTLLDLSMLESGNLFLQLGNVDVGEIVSKLENNYLAKLEKKGIIFNNQIPARAFFVEADQRLLHQVLDNMLSNAIKYTEKGSVTLGIRVDAERVIISVTDTGIGIKPEFFSMIFEEFRQVSEGLDRRYEGSGLGLHVSKRFIEKMNGQIWVESEFGKGSTFYVALKGFASV
jgi:PAS domain S-box-containing protein